MLNLLIKLSKMISFNKSAVCTVMLCVATTVSAQEMIYEDDFSWLSIPSIQSSPNLSISTTNGVKDNDEYKFIPAHIKMKGVQNPGWSQGVFDLNADHTQRMAPESGVEPENFFDHAYNSVWMRPGLLKIGYGGFGGALLTPEMEKLGERTADVEVTFQLCAASAADGTKDANDVYIGLWDHCPGEIDNADHEQLANQWYYECKALKITNYQNSDAKEYGENYDEWDKSISLYSVTVKGAKANTRVYMFFGPYGTGIKQNTTPTTIDIVINGQNKTFNYKPTSNRIGLKGCWMKILKVTDNGNSGIEEINADNDEPVEYFNLQGIPVTNPSDGNVYIKRQGMKVTKIIY